MGSKTASFESEINDRLIEAGITDYQVVPAMRVVSVAGAALEPCGPEMFHLDPSAGTFGRAFFKNRSMMAADVERLVDGIIDRRAAWGRP